MTFRPHTVSQTPQDALYSQFYLLVHLVSHRITEQYDLPPHLAADVAQAGFMGMLRSLRYRSTPSVVKTCIRNASRNAVRNEVLHAGRFVPEYPDEIQNPYQSDNLDSIEASLDVNKLLARLPAHQRKIIELTELQGFSMEEVAAQLGVSVRAFRSRRNKALAALRELAGVQYNDE